jgi:hypothetical protein
VTAVAERPQAAGNVGETRRRDRTEPLAQPRIGAVDAARRAPCPVALDATRRPALAIEAEPLDCERVQDPQLAAAVLHADRDIGAQSIERHAVQCAGDRLVVAGAAHPAACVGRVLAQCARKPGGVARVVRSASRGLERSGRREEMDVVVVHATPSLLALRLCDPTARRRARAAPARATTNGTPDKLPPA